MFSKVQFTNGFSLLVVDFLMTVGTGGGYIGITGFDGEIIAEGEDRSRMEANASWPTFNYFTRYLVVITADMICQNASDFQALKISTMQRLMPQPTVSQTDRYHGTLTIRPSGETQDWDLPVQVKSPPKWTQPGTSPSAGEFQVTFGAFRPYWHRAVADDYRWYT